MNLPVKLLDDISIEHNIDFFIIDFTTLKISYSGVILNPIHFPAECSFDEIYQYIPSAFISKLKSFFSEEIRRKVTFGMTEIELSWTNPISTFQVHYYISYGNNDSVINVSGYLKNNFIIPNFNFELIKDSSLSNLILNTIPIRVFWKDSSLKYLGCNKKFAEDAGLIEPFEIVGKKDHELPWAGEQAEIFNHDDLYVLSTGESQLNYEECIKLSSGKEIWARTNKVPLINNDGKTIGVLGCYLDISDLKNSEEQFIIAKSTAESNEKTKNLFLKNLSHEIRTPLTAIVAYSDMLSKNEISLTEIPIFSQAIQLQSDNLLKLISDLLDLALIESGELKIENEAFSCKDFFTSLLESLEQKIITCQKSHLNVLSNVKDINNNIYLFADENRLKQVIFAILDNAIKFTEFGSIEVKIVSEKNSAKIIIKDSGPGLTPYEIDKAFDKFWKSERGITKNGLGIGLTIAKGLLSLMNGEIELRSSKGRGVTAEITIPQKFIEKQTSDSENKIIKTEKEIYERLKGKKIMVADDVYYIHEIINLMLSNTEVKIEFANNGKDAVEKYQNNPDYDLILMDIQMDSMNGIEAQKKIKQINPGIKIIAFTAYSLSGDKEKYLKLGFDDYISKPLKKNELIEMLSRNF